MQKTTELLTQLADPPFTTSSKTPEEGCLRKRAVPTTALKQARYGIERLAKVETAIQEKLAKQAKRYNKSYPGEMVHVDTKQLSLLKGQVATDRREYLLVAIDDFSRAVRSHIARPNGRRPPYITSHHRQAASLNFLL